MAKKEKKPKKMFRVGRMIILTVLVLFFVSGFILHWFVNSDIGIDTGATTSRIKDGIGPKGPVEEVMGDFFNDPNFKLLLWDEELIWTKNNVGEYNDPAKQIVIRWNWILGGYETVENRVPDEGGPALGGEIVSHPAPSIGQIISIVMGVMIVGFSFLWFAWPFIRKKKVGPPAEKTATE